MFKRKRLIGAGFLVAVFLVSVIVFSYLTNKDNNNMTADMKAPTLPQLSFSYSGYNLNLLSGYVHSMDISSMRETITPVLNNRLTLILNDYGNEIEDISYHIYTLSGTDEVDNGVIDEIAQNMVIELDDEVLSKERNMRLDMKLASGKMVYYYTRIKDAAGTDSVYNLDYIDRFFKTEMGKNEDDSYSVADDLEPNVLVDDYSYQHVDITSDRQYVTWGELDPKLVGTVRYEVKEMNEVYTSVLLKYQVQCKGEENEKDLYDVEEFFRVRYIEGRAYLLNYDRSMNQIFDPSGVVLDEKGILLGISDPEVIYDVNSTGTIVNFVQDGELWNYDKKQDKLSLLFSFADGESSDERNLNTEHEIDIIDTDRSGNTTFAVYGYMNRGEHEGEVGAAFYYYDKGKNTIEEKAFVASSLSAERAVDQLKAMIYYSVEGQAVYAMVDGTLYCYSVFFESTDTILEKMEDEQYALAFDVRRVAYHEVAKDGTPITNSITVLDLEDRSERKITAEAGENIWPLGFIGEDIVYGLSKIPQEGEEEAKDKKKKSEKADTSEEVVSDTQNLMYKLVIESPNGNILKVYEEQGIYIESADFSENMATLNRVALHGDNYVTVASDYIMNNEEKKNSNITADEYYGDIKLTQMRLTFKDGISDHEPKILKPKHVLFESSVSLDFGIEAGGDKEERYYVYGLGGLRGSYEHQGRAIHVAARYNGVVVSSSQKYVWESGNRDLKYECYDEELIEKICKELRRKKSPQEVIKSLNDGEYSDLTGCKAEELLYIINTKGPVIAMLNPAEYAVLTGYGDGMITYLLPGEKSEDGFKEVEKELSELDVMTNSSGSIYYGF